LSFLSPDRIGRGNQVAGMRIKPSYLFIFLIILFTIVYGDALRECYGENPQNSYTLSIYEVQDILIKIRRPDAKILSIQMSPVKGLWEVIIENKGQFELFYVDFSKTYLIPGPIIDLNTGIDKSREQLTELEKRRRIDLSRIPLEDALILGDKEATLKVIVFTDPDCSFCEKLHGEIKKVAERRKDIAFYIKLYPLQIHPDAYWKSKSIQCNKSLNLLEDNFEKKPIPRPECETKEIDENIKLARDLGIMGTPTVIMPDGSIHPGFVEADQLIAMVDSSGTKKR
jgi:thiol:disulfide interchange protein DsbC